ncbi:unnamed protein product [Cochlearia groenlandica]
MARVPRRVLVEHGEGSGRGGFGGRGIRGGRGGRGGWRILYPFWRERHAVRTQVGEPSAPVPIEDPVPIQVPEDEEHEDADAMVPEDEDESPDSSEDADPLEDEVPEVPDHISISSDSSDDTQEMLEHISVSSDSTDDSSSVISVLMQPGVTPSFSEYFNLDINCDGSDSPLPEQLFPSPSPPRHVPVTEAPPPSVTFTGIYEHPAPAPGPIFEAPIPSCYIFGFEGHMPCQCVFYDSRFPPRIVCTDCGVAGHYSSTCPITTSLPPIGTPSTSTGPTLPGSFPGCMCMHCRYR